MCPGHKLGTGIEHLVLRVATGEFRANGIPSQLQEFDAVCIAAPIGRDLHALNDGGHLWIVIVGRGGRQHNKRASGQLAQRVDHLRIKLLCQRLCRINSMTIGHEVLTPRTALHLHADH